MKKIFFFLCNLLLIISVTGCRQEIPEGDIKDFVMNIDYEKSFEAINSGKSIITATYYVDDQIDGQVCSTTYFDKTTKEKYHYINTDVFGSFFGSGSNQYLYKNEKILTYINSDDTISTFKKTDGVDIDIKYSDSDVQTAINNFFYLNLNAGYHSGGVYYGDYIYANCAKYYGCFSLNEDKTILTYEVNTSTINSENDEIVTMHKFSVNEYGMVISLSSKSIYYAKNIIMHTTIECEYNIKIDRLENLEI